MPARKSSSTSKPTSHAAAKAKSARAPAKKAVAAKATRAKKTAPARVTPARPAPARPAPARPARVAAKPVAPVARLTAQDHKHLEGRLLEERARLVKELGYREANVLNQNPRDSSGDLSGYSFHMADAGTDAMEREKAFLFASTEGRVLHDVDEALRRMYKGEYGMCESCNEPIAAPRLEVVPHARLCIKCKEREEKAGRR